MQSGPPGRQAGIAIRVISLRDGLSLWSRPLEYAGLSSGPGFEIGTAEPGRPATVYIMEAPGTQTSNELIVRALDGRDGAVRWSWSTGAGQGLGRFDGGIDLIDLDGKGKDSICLTYSNHRRECRVVILDSEGQERARRDIPREPEPTQYFPPVGDFVMDFDGDGRDELLVWHNRRLSAWGRDLKALWSIPLEHWPNAWLLPAPARQPRLVFLPPMTAIDGTSGQVSWMDKSAPGKPSTCSIRAIPRGEPCRSVSVQAPPFAGKSCR